MSFRFWTCVASLSWACAAPAATHAVRLCGDALKVPPCDYDVVVYEKPDFSDEIGRANNKRLREYLALQFRAGQTLASDPNTFEILLPGNDMSDRFLVHYQVEVVESQPPEFIVHPQIVRAVSEREEIEHWDTYAYYTRLRNKRFGRWPGSEVRFNGRTYSRIILEAGVRARLLSINKLTSLKLTELMEQIRFPLTVCGGLEESLRSGFDVFRIRLEPRGNELFLVDAKLSWTGEDARRASTKRNLLSGRR